MTAKRSTRPADTWLTTIPTQEDVGRIRLLHSDFLQDGVLNRPIVEETLRQECQWPEDRIRGADWFSVGMAFIAAHRKGVPQAATATLSGDSLIVDDDVDERDRNILRVLARENIRMSLLKLETYRKFALGTRATLDTHLTRLRTRGYVDWTQGDHAGAAITRKGREYIEGQDAIANLHKPTEATA